LKQFKEGFAAILKDANVLALRQKYLKALRNKVTFHFDADVPTVSLPRLKNSDFIFASGREVTPGGVYYELSDDVVVDFLLGPCKSDEEYLARFEELLVGTSELFKQFLQSAHRLIPVALAAMGWRRRYVKRPQKPPDAP
jgi:hypothetical protein